MATTLYLLSLSWAYDWVSAHTPVLAWAVLIYIFSLPQSVLLWTDAGAPQAEVLEMQVAEQ